MMRSTLSPSSSRRPLRLAAALAAASILALPVQAMPPDGFVMRPDGGAMRPDGPREPRGAAGHEPVPPYLHGIDLSEAQRDKVFEILHALAPLVRARSREARHSRDALREMASAADFDDARARQLADAGARAMADLALAQARADRQIVRLLSDEQRRRMTERAAAAGRPPAGNPPCGRDPRS